MAVTQRYRAVLPKVAPVFHDLPEHLQQLVRLCDGHRSIAELAAQAERKRTEVGRLLDQLVEVGLLERAQAQSRPARARLGEATLEWLGSCRGTKVASDLPLESPTLLAAKDDAPPPAEPAPAPASAFSDDEEEFFSQSIDHLVEDDFLD